MSRTRVYPISDSFRKTLKTVDSFRSAIRLNRLIKHRFDISTSEVEIMILLASYADPIPLSDIVSQITHITPQRVTRLVNSLLKDGMIVENFDMDLLMTTFSISAAASITIKNIVSE